MRCNPCEGTGFANADQLDTLIPDWSETEPHALLEQVRDLDEPHDVTPCDCCGTGDIDADDPWYGTPGEHYNDADPVGPNGPYAYNGGVCECH